MRRVYVLVVTSVLVTGGCGGGNHGGSDGGTAGMITVSGALSRAGAQALGRGRLGPLDLPGLEDGSTVDRVVAVPHERGAVFPQLLKQVVIAPLQADGTFALELGTGFDWVLLLEDSTAAREERVRAYVTVGDLQTSLVNVPVRAARADLRLGMLSGSGDSATSETSLDQASQSFNLSLDTLKQMARVDDSYRTIVNAWINWNPDTELYYLVHPTMVWSDRLERLVAGTSTPGTYTFFGYYFSVATNDPRLSTDAVCNGTQTIRVVPPAPVKLANGDQHGPTQPMEFAGTPGQNGGFPGCSDFNLGFGDGHETGTHSIMVPGDTHFEVGGYFAELVPGWWHVEVDGEVVASFDLGLASPVDADGYPTGAVPAVRPTIDGSGLITALDLDWVRWDGASASFTPVDVDALEQLFKTSGVDLLGYTAPTNPETREQVSSTAETNVLTHAALAQRWFSGRPSLQPAGASWIMSVGASWTLGGVAYQVQWPMQGCYDLDNDVQSYCDGDPDDVLPDASWCFAANTYGDPITENGAQVYPIPGNYYGSFSLYFHCLWAPAKRPHARVELELKAPDGTTMATHEGKPYEMWYEQFLEQGAGDYTVTAKSYDALGALQETIDTTVRVLPFSAIWPEPTLKAELQPGGQLLLTVNHYTNTADSDCSTILTDATLALLTEGGCDTPLNTNGNCGGCGVTCPGTAACKTSGMCYDDAGSCVTPMMDCDGNPATGTNGCEIDLATDRLNCGACGHACATGFDCVGGMCAPRCPPAAGDCDDDPGTGPGGCETDLLATDAHCGACGHACSGGAACVDGLCVNASDTCAAGSADCDGNAGTGPGGCEASLYDDDANCGACGHACGAQERCRGGSCHPRCSLVTGDCQAPRSGVYNATACTFVGDYMKYQFTWASNVTPIAVGDRIALRPTTLLWECNWGYDYVNSYAVPCPGYYPALTTRVVAAP